MSAYQHLLTVASGSLVDEPGLKVRAVKDVHKVVEREQRICRLLCGLTVNASQ